MSSTGTDEGAIESLENSMNEQLRLIMEKVDDGLSSRTHSRHQLTTMMMPASPASEDASEDEFRAFVTRAMNGCVLVDRDTARRIEEEEYAHRRLFQRDVERSLSLWFEVERLELHARQQMDRRNRSFWHQRCESMFDEFRVRVGIIREQRQDRLHLAVQLLLEVDEPAARHAVEKSRDIFLGHAEHMRQAESVAVAEAMQAAADLLDARHEVERDVETQAKPQLQLLRNLADDVHASLREEMAARGLLRLEIQLPAARAKIATEWSASSGVWRRYQLAELEELTRAPVIAAEAAAFECLAHDRREALRLVWSEQQAQQFFNGVVEGETLARQMLADSEAAERELTIDSVWQQLQAAEKLLAHEEQVRQVEIESAQHIEYECIARANIESEANVAREAVREQLRVEGRQWQMEIAKALDVNREPQIDESGHEPPIVALVDAKLAATSSPTAHGSRQRAATSSYTSRDDEDMGPPSVTSTGALKLSASAVDCHRQISDLASSARLRDAIQYEYLESVEASARVTLAAAEVDARQQLECASMADSPLLASARRSKARAVQFVPAEDDSEDDAVDQAALLATARPLPSSNDDPGEHASAASQPENQDYEQPLSPEVSRALVVDDSSANVASSAATAQTADDLHRDFERRLNEHCTLLEQKLEAFVAQHRQQQQQQQLIASRQRALHEAAWGPRRGQSPPSTGIASAPTAAGSRWKKTAVALRMIVNNATRHQKRVNLGGNSATALTASRDAGDLPPSAVGIERHSRHRPLDSDLSLRNPGGGFSPASPSLRMSVTPTQAGLAVGGLDAESDAAVQQPLSQLLDQIERDEHRSSAQRLHDRELGVSLRSGNGDDDAASELTQLKSAVADSSPSNHRNRREAIARMGGAAAVPLNSSNGGAGGGNSGPPPTTAAAAAAAERARNKSIAVVKTAASGADTANDQPRGFSELHPLFVALDCFFVFFSVLSCIIALFQVHPRGDEFGSSFTKEEYLVGYNAFGTVFSLSWIASRMFLARRRGDWEIIDELPRIREIYIRSWLMYDLLYAAPIDFIFAIWAWPIYRWLQLRHFLRLPRIFNLGQSHNPLRSTRLWFRFMSFCYMMLLTMHVLGCIFWALEAGASYDESLYWAVATMTSVGYGDVIPTTFAGRVYVCFAMFFGTFMLSTMTAFATSFLTQKNKLQEEQDSKKQMMYSMLEYYNVPWDVQKEVIAAVPAMLEKDNENEFRKMTSKLPPFVAEKIDNYVRVKLLRIVPLFAAISDTSALLELSKLLRQHFYPAGQVIVEQGARDRGMYFVVHGVVEMIVLLDPDDEDGDGNFEAVITGTLQGGMYFGEETLFAPTPRPVTAQAVTVVECLALSFSDFIEFAKQHPATTAQLRVALKGMNDAAAAIDATASKSSVQAEIHDRPRPSPERAPNVENSFGLFTSIAEGSVNPLLPPLP